jgi:hypothetical protein
MPMFKQWVAITATALGLTAFGSHANAADTVLVIVSHEVADFGEWKKRFDAGKANREKAGLKERYVMRDASKPSAVIVVMETANVDTAKKFAADPAFNERVKKASSTGTADIKIGTTNPAGK